MAPVADVLTLAIQNHQSGNLAGAESLYRQILASKHDHVDALHLLGILMHQTGRHETGIGLIRKASAIQPRAVRIHLDLGLIFKDLGKPEEAISCFRRALCLDPHQVGALEALGNVLREQGRVAEAAECFRQALRLQPDNDGMHNSLGAALQEQGHFEEAVRSFRRALQLNPQNRMALNNLGGALKDQGHLSEAVGCFQEVLRLDPNNANAHNNLGVALKDLGRLEEAAACHERALALVSDATSAHWVRACARWNLSLLKLLKGDLANAWPDFEYRSRLFGVSQRHAELPRWDGSALEGKTILLHAEQGLGDTLQLVRYAREVKKRGGSVVLECAPILTCLLDGVAGIDQIVARGAASPTVDVQAPLMSLPGIFSTTLATIPTSIPYLRASPDLVQKWRKGLEPLGGFKVGIAWQGNPKHAADRYRSLPLTRLEPLARVEEVRLVSLQKGIGSEQASAGFPILDLSDGLHTFMDTAAVVMNLDLVITIDSAVAHLAGALGVPVWTLLHFVPDWRWLLERPDSPWYPTMRLFRQARQGDWGEVVQRAADALRSLIKTCKER
jgi:Tfp pilus assembly protein PilF